MKKRKKQSRNKKGEKKRSNGQTKRTKEGTGKVSWWLRVVFGPEQSFYSVSVSTPSEDPHVASFYWETGRVGSCELWSLCAGMLRSRALNTHRRRNPLMSDCDAPFCHHSITEGHSFTITVGLWVSADIMNTVTLWPVAGESRQEFLTHPNAFRPLSDFPLILNKI